MDDRWWQRGVHGGRSGAEREGQEARGRNRAFRRAGVLLTGVPRRIRGSRFLAEPAAEERRGAPRWSCVLLQPGISPRTGSRGAGRVSFAVFSPSAVVPGVTFGWSI